MVVVSHFFLFYRKTFKGYFPTAPFCVPAMGVIDSDLMIKISDGDYLGKMDKVRKRYMCIMLSKGSGS